MENLDFRNCKTPEDVEKVFDKSKEFKLLTSLIKELRNTKTPEEPCPSSASSTTR